MSFILEEKQCLIAGDGKLPVILAQNAKKNGFNVIAISLSSDNRKELKKYCSKIYTFGPGEIGKIRKTLKDEQIKQLTFIGKVHKGLVLRCPKFDKEALDILKQMERLNDDAIMLKIVDMMEEMGIQVLDQTVFIQNLMAPQGVLGKYYPTEEQGQDVNYGFWLAKEMGKLDVGQSVVIKDRMIMAIEAIEGTDKCIARGGKIARQGATVVKVAKPTQDKRFDIPTIGVNTLKLLKKYKCKLLAIEAGETIIVNQKEVVEYADKHKIVLMAV